VRLIVFPGGFNWPVWVAQEQGLFARHGVDVDVVPTPGSVHQWTSLAQGDADVAITLMDNVIAYREGQGEAAVTVPDAIAVMGFDTRVMPSLVTSPSIATYDALRGKSLAVDAVRTGNALVLIGMLERAGLARDQYGLERAGGVAQRFDAMLRGEYAGALFNAPFDAMLREKGFHVLDSAASLLARFQAHVVAVRSAWADLHRPQLVSFIRALLDALAWLYAPANRGEAHATYTRRLPDASASDARASYALLFDQTAGFPRNGDIDLDGVRAVLVLRARYGEPAKSLGSVGDYCDRRFLSEALAADHHP
jgi:ABC-type nitrate/sulfonate/bicarbonate transport system substrate-binding protein